MAKIPLVILAGQSNMVGHGDLEELNQSRLPAGVKLFDLNPIEGRFGPEVGFAHALQNELQLDELWLVKYAVGGSSLLAWEPEWSAERADIAYDADKGALYSRLISHFKQVTQGKAVQVLACLWMQGESDSNFPVAAAEYERNLTRLIAQLRADTDQPELKFVLGLVNPLGARFTHLSTVREAQKQVAQTVPNVSLFDTEGLTKHEDGIHYDTGGQLELGRRFAQRLQLDLSDQGVG